MLHLIFGAAQVLVQAGFGGGSPVLASTVELGSAVFQDREAVSEGRSLRNFEDCLENQTKLNKTCIRSLHSKRRRYFNKYWAQTLLVE